MDPLDYPNPTATDKRIYTRSAADSQRATAVAPPPNARVTVSGLQDEIDKATTLVHQELFELEMMLGSVLEPVPAEPGERTKPTEPPNHVIERQKLAIDRLQDAIGRIRGLRRRVML